MDSPYKSLGPNFDITNKMPRFACHGLVSRNNNINNRQYYNDIRNKAIRRKIIINNFRLIGNMILDILYEIKMISLLAIESAAGVRSANDRIFNILEKLSEIKYVFDVTIQIYRTV